MFPVPAPRAVPRTVAGWTGRRRQARQQDEAHLDVGVGRPASPPVCLGVVAAPDREREQEGVDRPQRRRPVGEVVVDLAGIQETAGPADETPLHAIGHRFAPCALFSISDGSPHRAEGYADATVRPWGRRPRGRAPDAPFPVRPAAPSRRDASRKGTVAKLDCKLGRNATAAGHYRGVQIGAPGARIGPRRDAAGGGDFRPFRLALGQPGRAHCDGGRRPRRAVQGRRTVRAEEERMWRTGIAVCIAVAACAHAARAQTGGQPHGAAFIVPDHPPKMTPADVGRGDWLFYNNVFVNKASGFCLGIRAQEVEVYVEDIKWWTGGTAVGEPVTSVTGNTIEAGPDFRHHGVTSTASSSSSRRRPPRGPESGPAARDEPGGPDARRPRPIEGHLRRRERQVFRRLRPQRRIVRSAPARAQAVGRDAGAGRRRILDAAAPAGL